MAVVIRSKEKEFLSGEGYEVICLNCGQIFHETTEKFTEEEPANASMFRLLKPYGPLGANWSSFPPDSWIVGDALECPGCGAPYPRGGTRVKVRKRQPSIVEIDMDRREAFVKELTHNGQLTGAEIFNPENAETVKRAAASLAPTAEDQEAIDTALIDEIDPLLRIPEDDLPDDDAVSDDEIDMGSCCNPQDEPSDVSQDKPADVSQETPEEK